MRTMATMNQLKRRLHEIVFEADTKYGRLFDIVLLIVIILSVVCVLLESVDAIRADFRHILYISEWVFTILFTIEYILRITLIGKPIKYVFSFYGIVDLLAILPSYLVIFFSGAQSLIIIRSLRLLRIFRIFKLVQFLGEAQQLMLALKTSLYKVSVFLITVLISVCIMGTLMYSVEASNPSFSSIPKSIYWAIVTITTVGYGDMVPITPLGQFISGILMIMGYGVIAVPTGIVSVELAQAKKEDINTRNCSECSSEGHAFDAVHCKYCGAQL